ncbi:MAG: ROK family transcriptional regulator [Anaerolineae bacterium]|nr:ROK family transcriptional regulator [Anaerolineae bacterium]
MRKPELRGNRELIKAMNRNLLLNIIRREGQLSRTHLIEVSGLSAGAVSQIINELLDDRWLLEIGEGEYTGGRRQMLLRLNPDAGYAVGLKLMERRVVCAVTNFEGNILYYAESPVDGDYQPGVMAADIARIVTTTLTAARVPGDRVLGVGIGLAGVIHPQQGIVHYSPFLGWRDVALAALVQAHLRLPVYVENDVNTLTLSEQLFGAGRHQSNFVVVTIGRGIGMGMIINGQLYQGSRGGAGELGHILLNLPLARDHGLEAGTLEGLAADPAVLRSVDGHVESASLAHVVDAARSGQADARRALALSGEYLGVGLATVINILCPPLIIVSGEGVVAGDFRLRAMYEAMRRYTFNGLLDGVEVIVKPADDQTWARGAANLAIGKVFASPLVEPMAQK